MVGAGRRRVFHETFKREAVEQITASGLPVHAVAAKLGIHETMLRRWAHEFQPAQEMRLSNLNPLTTICSDSPEADLLAENGLLRGEIKRLRADREVLKKALAMAFEAKA